MTPTVADEIWGAIAPLCERTLALPFVEELGTGALPHEVFGRFIVQDAKYLEDYSRALAMCGARVSSQDDLIFFCEAASRVVQVERSMQAQLLAELGIPLAQVARAEQIPSMLGYTSWIKQACGIGQRHEALAAVLPCFWLYREVGVELARRGGSPDPLYQRWIDTYAGDAFGAATDQAVETCVRIGATLGATSRAEMVRIARVTARYDWMVWHGVYVDERWPV